MPTVYKSYLHQPICYKNLDKGILPHYKLTVRGWWQTNLKPHIIMRLRSFITARVRRMMGGYVFTGVCLYIFLGDTPIQPRGYRQPSWWGGYPILPNRGWGYYPHPDLGRGVLLCPWYPSSWYPPSRPGKEYCHPDLVKGVPPPPPTYRSEKGQVIGWGGGTPNRNSIVCTCYAAGGMPLAFTQEDFLVFTYLHCLVDAVEVCFQVKRNPPIHLHWNYLSARNHFIWK